MPLLHHHSTDQLHETHKYYIKISVTLILHSVINPVGQFITLVILLCDFVKYFLWVFSRSSPPPAIARIILSAMRLSWRQSSTAPSKSPVSRACVISPSTSKNKEVNNKKIQYLVFRIDLVNFVANCTFNDCS